MNHKLKCSKKRLRKNTLRKSVQDLGLAQEFLNMTLQAQIIKGQIDKLDFVKNKTFALPKLCEDNEKTSYILVENICKQTNQLENGQKT